MKSKEDLKELAKEIVKFEMKCQKEGRKPILSESARIEELIKDLTIEDILALDEEIQKNLFFFFLIFIII